MRADSTNQAAHTWEDFLALGEDDLRELIDGVFLEIDVAGRTHERIVAQLASCLVAWVRGSGGEVLGSGYKVRISERRGVMPDLQYFVAKTARTLPEEGLAQGRPDLAIEVVSPTSRRYDRVVKLAWYAKIGVPEYWIVDPEERSLERYLLQGEALVLVETAREDALFAPATLAGLRIPLRELWKPADASA